MREPFYHYRRQVSGSLSVDMRKFRNYKKRVESREIIEDIVKDTPYYPIYKNRWEQEDRRYVYLDVRIATIYNKDSGKGDKIKLIKEVLNSNECKKAFSVPIRGAIPFQMKVLYYLISHKYPRLLYYTINLKFREKIER